jgi:CubicO group peptidase (beta-lactamase class C family)
MKPVRILFLAGLIVLSLAARASVAADTARKIADLAEAHSRLEMFSGTLLVAEKGKVIYAAAFGLADKDHRVPNTLKTRYNIGSIGKAFTAVGIMQLAEEGKLRLTDTLGRYYPECPFPEKDSITVHHLLTHTSGLGDYLEHREYRARMGGLRSVDDALPLIFDQKPDFAPGERFRYSNSAFRLLGGVIERASGLSYREYLRWRIFEPCGMTESDLAREDEVLADRAIGYTQNANGAFTSNVLVIPPPCPAGGLRTSVGDLLLFDRALRDGRLLSGEATRTMLTPSPRRATYACGWEVKEYDGHSYVGHSGGADGVEAFFYRFLDPEYTVIVLANYHNGAEELASGILALLFDKPYSLPTVADANFRLGYRMQGENMLREAAAVFARNLGSDPPHLLSLFFAANVRIRGGFEVEKAIEYLDRFLQLAGPADFPPPSMVWEQKANAYRKLGLKPEAIRALEKALELDPQNVNLREQLEKLRKG